MGNIRKDKLQRIEKALRADIRWAIRTGVGWHPEAGAFFDQDEKKWVADTDSLYEDDSCGVCAVGAHVLRHQPRPRMVEHVHGGTWAEDNVEAAARSLGVSSEWLETLYYAVMDDPDADSEDAPYDQAAQLGHRLRDYATAYQKKAQARAVAK